MKCAGGAIAFGFSRFSVCSLGERGWDERNEMKLGAKNDRDAARNANDYVDTPGIFLDRFSPPIFFSGFRHVKFFTISRAVSSRGE